MMRLPCSTVPGHARLDIDGAPVLEREADDVERIAKGVEAEIAALAHC